MNKTINILILSCGRRVELVKAFRKAKDRLGVYSSIVGADASTDAPALFFVDKKWQLPRVNSDSYISAVIDICKKEKISLVVPTIDTELLKLANNKERILDECGAQVLVSDKSVIEICRDKNQTAKFLKDNGFACPYTYTSQELADGRCNFPLFIKPYDGSSSINAFKVNNTKELEFFLSYVPNPMTQECVSGVEYTVDVFIGFDKEIISVVPRKRIAVRAGEILKGQIDINSVIIEDVTKLIKVMGAIGHITVQGFLGVDNVFRYIEINPRFGGGAPMAIKAGADSCEWLYRLLSGQKIDKSAIAIKDKAVFSRFDDSIEVTND